MTERAIPLIKPMFTVKELTALRVGDVIDTGAFVFENLSEKECVTLTVRRRVIKNKLVEFEVSYFGINIGTWIAQVAVSDPREESGPDRVLWMDQNKSRADREAKGKETKKKMGGKRARRYH